MLQKDKRLNLRSEFNRVVRGKRIETNHFKLYASLDAETITRIGISISKKNYPKAHERNYVKRQIYRVFESLYPRLLNGLELIILPKKGILETDFSKLSTEMEECLVDYGLALRYNN